MVVRIVAGLLVVAALVAGCSEESPPQSQPQPGAGLTELSGDELCDLLPAKSVEDAFGDKVTKTKGDSTAKAPFTIVSCKYSIDFKLAEVETLPPGAEVKVSLPARGDEKQALDRAFTDLDDKVVRYEQVDGLGVAAGFGPDATLEDLGGDQLVVLIDAGGERYEMSVGATPKATLEQLKPLAEELLPGLTKTLGG